VRPEDLVITRWGARFKGRSFPCAIGRGGICPEESKREGDGGTPDGVHDFVGMLYRADRLGRGEVPRWAVPIGPGDLWSDDVKDPDYNLMVRAPHGFSHERLLRPDPLYDLVLITDFNWPRAERGRGSAIFLHVWRGPRVPTAGCVAFRKRDLLWIARRLEYRSKVVVRGDAHNV
jgi:L,D-peptidoglycan transpeptidase YkuD (ErfK/YbiS/YcfS/YnhG family)